MNNYEQIKVRMKEIDEEVSLLLNDPYSETAYPKAQELYREFLKLYVQIERPFPISGQEPWPYDNNCYFYALDLPTPKNYSQICYQSMVYGVNVFSTHVGLISGYKDSDKIRNLETFLDRLASDLDCLQIRSYESDIESIPFHDGYKIAIFFEKDKLVRPDYHFVRQNQDGTWSQKFGYFDNFLCSDNPFDFKNGYNNDYEYIKTLEIVKPRLK